MSNEESESGMSLLRDMRNRSQEDHARLNIEGWCKTEGYGWVMHHVSKWWGEVNKDKGIPGAEHIVGPCRSGTVPCLCRAEDSEPTPEDQHCIWCNGCGWLTESVYALVE